MPRPLVFCLAFALLVTTAPVAWGQATGAIATATQAPANVAPANPAPANTPQPPAADAHREELAILDLLRIQQEAWNRADLTGFMQGYLKSDELTFYSGSVVASGWQAALDRYRRRYLGEGRSMGVLDLTTPQVTVLAPDSALVRGAWRVTQPDGSAANGLFTVILRKTADGWRIVHDHSS